MSLYFVGDLNILAIGPVSFRSIGLFCFLVSYKGKDNTMLPGNETIKKDLDCLM